MTEQAPTTLPAARRLELAGLLLLGILPFFFNGLYNPRLAHAPRWFWTVEVLTWIALPAAVCAWGRHRRLFAAADLGLHTRVAGRPNEMWFVLCLLAVPPVLVWLDRRLFEMAVETFPTNPLAVGFHYRDMIPPAGPATGFYRLLATLHLAVTAGVVEEFYYRALARRLFGAGRVAGAAYVVLSSLVFAAVHWEFGARTLFEALGVGLAASALYLMMRNLWPLIAGHVLVDFLWLVQP